MAENIKSFFREWLDRRELSLQRLADLTETKGTKIPRGTLQKYMDGSVSIPDEKLDVIAQCLLPSSDWAAVEKFKAELVEVQEKERTTGQEWRILALGELDYYPITGRNSFFHALIARRFCRSAGLNNNVSGESSRLYRSIRAAQDDLFDGRVDLLSNLITVDRQARMKFVAPFPIWISIGAVVWNRHSRNLEEIRTILTKGPQDARLQFRPVTVRREVGWRHCLNLGFRDDPSEMVVLEDLNPAQISDVLQEHQSKHPDVVFAVVVDELTHLKVLQELPENWGIPAIPLTTENSARDHPIRREMPLHQLGLAVSRGRDAGPDLPEFLGDAIKTFITCELEVAKEELIFLAGRLESLVKSATEKVPLEFLVDAATLQRFQDDDAQRESLCQRWVRFALSLSYDDIHNESIEPYWKPVLRRARQTFDENLSAPHRAGGIRRFVDAVGMRYSWHHMTKILHECQQEFDIQLNLKTPAPGPDSALALTYQIRSVLARRPIIPEPQFRLWETDEAQRDNSAIQVREHAKSLICEVIRQERQLHPRREDLLAGIALALDAETRSGPLLFVVCVVDEYPAGVLVSGHHHEGDSLMALFVRPAWRGNGLTQRLIGKWQSYAMERRLTRLRVQAAIFDEEHVALLEMASFRGPNQCAGGNLEWTPPSNVPDALPTPESSNPQATLS